MPPSGPITGPQTREQDRGMKGVTMGPHRWREALSICPIPYVSDFLSLPRHLGGAHWDLQQGWARLSRVRYAAPPAHPLGSPPFLTAWPLYSGRSYAEGSIILWSLTPQFKKGQRSAPSRDKTRGACNVRICSGIHRSVPLMCLCVLRPTAIEPSLSGELSPRLVSSFSELFDSSRTFPFLHKP